MTVTVVNYMCACTCMYTITINIIACIIACKFFKTASQNITSSLFNTFNLYVHVHVPYSRKIWRFGGLYYNRQNFLLTYIHMAIPYRTAKFKFANILTIALNRQI